MFSGSIVALVTPMNDDNSIDWAALEKLLEWHVSQGTDGVISMGTTGESATLTVKEHLAVIEKTVQIIDGRLPVIAGTGANSTSEAIELTREAKALGADAVLLVTPYYNKPTQEGLYLHHKAIAEAVDIPQLLYNVPGRTACDMQADTVERLSKVSNIIGIKEATGDIARGKEIRRRCDESFILLSGDDETFVELMKVGAIGNVSVTANIAPAQMSAICKAANHGDFAEAEKANSALQSLHESLFLEANPIPVKWALHRMDKIGSAIRLPLTPFSVDKQPRLEAAMKKAGLL